MSSVVRSGSSARISSVVIPYDHSPHRCDREAQPPDAWQASHDIRVVVIAFVGHESMLAVADVSGTIHESRTPSARRSGEEASWWAL